jgi:hypothetical protein
MKIDKPGIYQMPMEEYISDPATEPSLNASTAHTLLTESPYHAWIGHPKLNPNHVRQESSRLEMGSIAHAVLIEGDESKVKVVEADDWRTKAAKDERDEARAANLIPILAKDMATVRKMVEIATTKIFTSEFCEAWIEATPEQTLIWEENGIWFRSRPDKLTPDGLVYFDYKTVAGTAHPAKFAKGPVISHGYDLQAALGKRGVKSLLQQERCTVIFIVQEINEPYAVSFVSLSPQFMSIAAERLELAIYQWSKCRSSNSWPSYPERVAYVEPPGYYGMDSLDSLGEVA